MGRTEGEGRGPWFEALSFVGARLVALPWLLRLVLLFAWMGTIWVLSSQTFPALPAEPGLWAAFANLAHAPLFGLLALFLTAVLAKREPGGWRRVRPRDALAIVTGVALYGVLDEWHQGHTPGRQPSGFDLATDVVGAACVVWITSYLGRTGATERGLRQRLLAGVLACVLTASLETLVV